MTEWHRLSKPYFYPGTQFNIKIKIQKYLCFSMCACAAASSLTGADASALIESRVLSSKFDTGLLNEPSKQSQTKQITYQNRKSKASINHINHSPDNLRKSPPQAWRRCYLISSICLGTFFSRIPSKSFLGSLNFRLRISNKKKQSTSITSDPSPCTAIQQTTNPNPIAAAAAATTTLH